MKMVKKVLTWGGGAFLVFFVAYRPGPASNVAKTIGGAIWGLWNGFGTFFSSLVS